MYRRNDFSVISREFFISYIVIYPQSKDTCKIKETRWIHSTKKGFFSFWLDLENSQGGQSHKVILLKGVLSCSWYFNCRRKNYLSSSRLKMKKQGEPFLVKCAHIRSVLLSRITYMYKINEWIIIGTQTKTNRNIGETHTVRHKDQLSLNKICN